MTKIYDDLTQLVGNTPLMELKNYKKLNQLYGNIYGKLEYKNPTGSVKDRIALAMIIDAEEKGRLKKNTVIIEPTSGNTGIGLAGIATAKGYKLILTMPETMSIERRQMLKALGAELVLTEGAKGMKGAIAKVDELLQEIPNSITLGQFINPANPEIHRKTTGPEIWEAMNGKIDYLVVGIGTGGTITGTGEYLKSKNSNIKVIAVEPYDSPILSKGVAGPHKIQGIGAGFIPAILNTSIYDEIIAVKIEEAYDSARKLSRSEGLLLGISSGAALFAASVIAARHENKDKNIAVILPDTGERYLSTPLFTV